MEIHAFDAVSLPSYHIYLPPCYGFDPETRYPVLYLLHGANYTDDQWLRLGATEGNPNFIIVMPFNKYSLRLVDDDEFGEIFIEDFLPFIDEAYLTRDEAKYRAIGGLSRGGGWAIHYGFTRWALFGAVGAHSPAIFYKDHNKLEKWLAEIPADAMPRLFVDVGDKDQELNSVISFEAMLNAQNIPHTWRFYTGFHDENYWAAHTQEYLAWYAAGFED